MVQKIDRKTLQELFLEALNGTDYRFVDGSNPFHILLNEKEYWIYIKNLTSAHFENPDIWRAQLPQRDDFAPIKESKTDFILLGYDGENDVYATWNPVWVKQRLNGTGNVSFYSRISLQQQVRQEKQFKRMQLSNEGEVVVFPRELTRMFFINVQSYFLAEGDYVAIGSKRRPEANETYKIFTDTTNIAKFARHMATESKSQITISNYCRVVRTFLTDGTITKHRKIFYAYDSLEGYRLAISQFVTIDDIKEKNDKWHNLISAAFNAYLDFLIPATQDISQEDIENTLPLESEEDCHDEKGLLADTAHDWEAEFTDFNGKLTRIANPDLIDRLRPYLDTYYKKTAAALNTIEEFYGNRFPKMEFSDWGKLLNNIDWTAPYVHSKPSNSIMSETDAPKRSKKHTLRVEFPSGKVIQSPIVSDTYVAAIKEIDPELVELVGLSHAGVNIVSQTLDSKYAKYQKSIGEGWYVMTNSSTITKSIDLQTISDELDLGLKVELIPIDGSEAASIETTESTRSKIRVTFPDGHIICPTKVLEALIEVVKYAGADQVRELNIICCGNNLILKEPAPRYKRPSKPVGNGWLCNTCSDTATKFAQINEISNKLQLGLIVELI